MPGVTRMSRVSSVERRGKKCDQHRLAPAAPPLSSPGNFRTFPVEDYDLAVTLSSGQAFRWRRAGDGWHGVIGSRWVRLSQTGSVIAAETLEPVSSWDWLTDYLQLQVDLSEVLTSFPDDETMCSAVAACRGLRLLRQDIWECLASFILSSTKQIVQIQQIVELLCERYGEAVSTPPGIGRVFAFPSPARLAALSEGELRACKMGFRAPFVLGTARAIDRGELDLERLPTLPVEAARTALMQLPGVGRKIADCVLLFACGCQQAFPLDVWMLRVLRQRYFLKRRVTLSRLHRFASTHFGPYAGFAQQYLYHYARTKRSPKSEVRSPKPALT
jgi:N-glycosylase/DNA lyase